MTDTTQITGADSWQNPYRNDYHPWRDGIFTTCISWVETTVGKGQRRAFSKWKAESQEWTVPPKQEPYYSLVFMTKRPNGLVEWHLFNIRSMSQDEIYAMEQRFVLNEYQQSILDAHYNGEVFESKLPLPNFENQVKAPKQPTQIEQTQTNKQIVKPSSNKWAETSKQLAEHYHKAGKPFTETQRELLREIAFYSYHDLPGMVQPWQLDLHNNLQLARTASQRKIHFLDLHEETLKTITDPKLRADKISFFEGMKAQYFDSEEEDKRMNAEWYARESVRRGTGASAPTNEQNASALIAEINKPYDPHQA